MFRPLSIRKHPSRLGKLGMEHHMPSLGHVRPGHNAPFVKAYETE